MILTVAILVAICEDDLEVKPSDLLNKTASAQLNQDGLNLMSMIIPSETGRLIYCNTTALGEKKIVNIF